MRFFFSFFFFPAAVTRTLFKEGRQKQDYFCAVGAASEIWSPALWLNRRARADTTTGTVAPNQHRTPRQWIPLPRNHGALTSQCLSPTSLTVIWGTSENLFHFTDILPPGQESCSPRELLPTSPWRCRRLQQGRGWEAQHGGVEQNGEGQDSGWLP